MIKTLATSQAAPEWLVVFCRILSVLYARSQIFGKVLYINVFPNIQQKLGKMVSKRLTSKQQQKYSKSFLTAPIQA